IRFVFRSRGLVFLYTSPAPPAGGVPDELITDTAIFGDEAHVRSRLKEWEDAGVTMMLISVSDADQMRRLQTLVSS
ncbi:LLM class F420-dependent oxidoreductase, partial [Nocardia sp. NPDC058497]